MKIWRFIGIAMLLTSGALSLFADGHSTNAAIYLVGGAILCAIAQAKEPV